MSKRCKLKYGNTSAFVHQDTMKKALRHPVTGELVDSMTRWNRINKEQGLECVGNDLLSNRKPELKDRITDELILDRIDKAESILRDPTKRRDYENMQRERTERHLKTVGNPAFAFRDEA